MAMSMVAINPHRADDRRMEEDDTRQRAQNARNLMIEIAEEVEKVPLGSTERHFHENSLRDLVGVLLDRSAGNKDRLIREMKKAILELGGIERGIGVPSEVTFSILSEIVEAAQEVVESSKVLDTPSG